MASNDTKLLDELTDEEGWDITDTEYFVKQKIVQMKVRTNNL
jgi:hypothetical protein